MTVNSNFTIEDSYLGYEKTLPSKLKVGQAVKQLDKKIRIDGVVMKQKMFILTLLQKGFKPKFVENYTYVMKNGEYSKPKDSYQMEHEDLSFYEINKTLFDYANYLVDNALISPTIAEGYIETERAEVQLGIEREKHEEEQKKKEEDLAKEKEKQELEERKKLRYSKGLKIYSRKADSIVRNEVTRVMKFFADEGYINDDALAKTEYVYQNVKNRVVSTLADWSSILSALEHAIERHRSGKFNLDYIDTNVYMMYKVLVKLIDVDLDGTDRDLRNKVKLFITKPNIVTKGNRPLSEILIDENNLGSKEKLLELASQMTISDLNTSGHIYLTYHRETGESDIYGESDIPSTHVKVEDVSVKLQHVFHRMPDVSKAKPDWNLIFYYLDSNLEDVQ
ncbi:hypothetical protein P4493_05190 [Bacillus thuringiensis]|jgi:hypothetical protein|uniref:Uncharacterized protein n=3 Tax=Bacillus thuringiensis TaxID=1428 RepID=A0A0B5NJN4_BACTU|nr:MULTISPECIES: hypothetical protein [Bacillus]MEC2536148.1 hypothetical protein [Bacillus cereus]MED1153610.1 hypothetical protein [Bacillus paranthracis]OUB09499.1 hypothetical protein BK708_33855 [Bacillus thuringiensis serovar yunnanensis]AFQ29936.1 hypothetical protein BTF1_29177 [Bacillus thuringiensis HD-789]AJG74126.1 hypothetical protein BF38_5724 [Bacillus thuringiensis]